MHAVLDDIKILNFDIKGDYDYNLPYKQHPTAQTIERNATKFHVQTLHEMCSCIFGKKNTKLPNLNSEIILTFTG